MLPWYVRRTDWAEMTQHLQDYKNSTYFDRKKSQRHFKKTSNFFSEMLGEMTLHLKPICFGIIFVILQMLRHFKQKKKIFEFQFLRNDARFARLQILYLFL